MTVPTNGYSKKTLSATTRRNYHFLQVPEIKPITSLLHVALNRKNRITPFLTLPRNHMNPLSTFALIIATTLFTACAEKKIEATSTQTTPILAMYGRNGGNELNCKITLTEGIHKYYDTTCHQDWDFYFVIENPREDGNEIIFFQDPNCNPYNERGFASYLVVDPEHGQPTNMLSVDAAKGASHGQELVPGITATQYSSPNRPMGGQISCIIVAKPYIPSL